MSNQNHHYVPQFYLRGFSTENGNSLVWQYSKKHKSIYKRPVSIKSEVCGEDNFYDVGIENEFSKIETKAERIYSAIFDHFDKSDEAYYITAEDLGCFSFFVGLHVTRTKVYREFTNNFAQSKCDDLLQHLIDTGEVPAPPTELVGTDGKLLVDVEITKHFLQTVMVNNAKDIGSKILEADNVILKTETSQFVTSDCPSYYEADAVNASGSNLVVPLSKKYLLYSRMHMHVDKRCFSVKYISDADVDKFNQRIFERANNYIYFSDKELFKSTIKAS